MRTGRGHFTSSCTGTHDRKCTRERAGVARLARKLGPVEAVCSDRVRQSLYRLQEEQDPHFSLQSIVSPVVVVAI